MGFFTSSDQTECFLLLSLILVLKGLQALGSSGTMPNSGQCPLRGTVPKKHLLNQQFPSLHAREIPPGSPPDQLCFACEDDGCE